MPHVGYIYDPDAEDLAKVLDAEATPEELTRAVLAIREFKTLTIASLTELFTGHQIWTQDEINQVLGGRMYKAYPYMPSFFPGTQYFQPK